MLPSREACLEARAALARAEVSRRSYEPARWQAVLELPAVREVLARALYVPTEQPDEDQVRIVRHLLSVPQGGPAPVPWFDDLVTTTATLLRLETAPDSEGTDYRVEVAIDGLGTYRLVWGFDDLHAAYAGWGPEAIAALFAPGRRVTCRYRRGEALQVALPAPFGLRPQAVAPITGSPRP